MSRLACAYSETTNLTGSILLELDQELGEVQVVALQNLMTTDYLRLKEHMGCEQFQEWVVLICLISLRLFKFSWTISTIS